MSRTASRTQRDSLVAFFALTFVITWGLAALVVIFPGPVTALFGPLSASSPLFVLAVAGPTIAATILTFARGGRSALGALYARLIRWRFGIRWYAMLLVGIPLVAYLTSRVAGPERKADLHTPALLVSFVLLQLILGPLGEELGWRGFALPRLLRRFSPLVASLILGAIWGVWHLPAFFLSGLPQAGLAIPLFLLMILCLSVLATWIFLGTGGSVLAVALFHLIVNCSINAFGVPQMAVTTVVAGAAALVIALDRGVGWLRHEPVRGDSLIGSRWFVPMPRPGVNPSFRSQPPMS